MEFEEKAQNDGKWKEKQICKVFESWFWYIFVLIKYVFETNDF